MKVINNNELIGKTIKVIIYNRLKGRVIFVLDDGNEIMIKSPPYNRYETSITKSNLFYKNRYRIDYREIHDICIKDIASDGTSMGIDYILIVDKNGDTYRTHCYVGEWGMTDNNFYDYSSYKKIKQEKKIKKQNRIDKIKSIFKQHTYHKI